MKLTKGSSVDAEMRKNKEEEERQSSKFKCLVKEILATGANSTSAYILIRNCRCAMTRLWTSTGNIFIICKLRFFLLLGNLSLPSINRQISMGVYASCHWGFQSMFFCGWIWSWSTNEDAFGTCLLEKDLGMARIFRGDECEVQYYKSVGSEQEVLQTLHAINFRPSNLQADKNRAAH